MLRLIAVDRLVHFLLLASLAAALFLLAHNKAALDTDFRQVLGVLPGDFRSDGADLLGLLRRLLAISPGRLYLIGAGATAYAVLEGAEAVGLWLGRRWAEYLTFIGNSLFVPYEVWELSRGVSALKLAALVTNLVIVAWLLVAKRLFGLRGGAVAERAERNADSGWTALERATPDGVPDR